ncbi:decaprenyl-diphosphate synthase subunit 1 isoform X2 [Octopus vulgaris]|uniref:Decaprenyl-diphosphate synthase subunit 1 isoform X2 n=1 Tax=Octopus vulgaris TaxID=6645 RepID=A0AA36ASE3_OCTVU|nr:decaprenyl-diphosphate synthase subunit 1 isoform X2 [Octopus vulgaris]
MTFVRSCCCSVRIFSISRLSVDWMIRRLYTTFNQKYYPVHNCTPCLLKRKIFLIRNHPANTVSPLISEIPSKLYSYQQHASTHHSNQDVHMKQFENSYKLVEDEFLMLNNDIKKLIYTIHPDLQEIAHYHLDGRGKSLRPMTVMLMAKSCNFHHIGDSTILHSQYVIAMISEMIHIASLMHDDVIDQSDIRRGKPSVKAVWGERKEKKIISIMQSTDISKNSVCAWLCVIQLHLA